MHLNVLQVNDIVYRDGYATDNNSQDVLSSNQQSGKKRTAQTAINDPPHNPKIFLLIDSRNFSTLNWR